MKLGVRKERTKWLMLLTVCITIVLCVALVAESQTGVLSSLIYGGKDENPFDNDGNGNDHDADDQHPEQMPNNPVITLSVNPAVIHRGDSTKVFITSNVPYARIELQTKYKGSTTAWQVASYVLGSDGDKEIQANDLETIAGLWQVRARIKSNNLFSNTDELQILGIAMMQEKNTWNVNETYTAMLMGSYYNWRVHFFVKNASSNVWIWFVSGATNAIGVIPYGTNSVVIDPSQAGTSRNLIGIISPTDANGNALYPLLEEYEGCVPESAMNDWENQGKLVKSNVLTVSINP